MFIFLIEVCGQFFTETIRIRSVLNCFKYKTKVIQRCLVRMHAWRKSVKLLKLDIHFRIMKRCKKMNSDNPKNYPRRAEEEIIVLAGIYLYERKQVHHENFKNW